MESCPWRHALGLITKGLRVCQQHWHSHGAISSHLPCWVQGVWQFCSRPLGFAWAGFLWNFPSFPGEVSTSVGKSGWQLRPAPENPDIEMTDVDAQAASADMQAAAVDMQLVNLFGDDITVSELLSQERAASASPPRIDSHPHSCPVVNCPRHMLSCFISSNSPNMSNLSRLLNVVLENNISRVAPAHHFVSELVLANAVPSFHDCLNYMIVPHVFFGKFQ